MQAGLAGLAGQGLVEQLGRPKLRELEVEEADRSRSSTGEAVTGARRRAARAPTSALSGLL